MEPEDKAADLVGDMRSTGLNHIAFDVGPAIEAEEGVDGLKGFLSELNRQVNEMKPTAVKSQDKPSGYLLYLSLAQRYTPIRERERMRLV